ncbi:hypothetical protein MKX01_042531 [Papaver californicum]|nr:hypothetical protein MKX01_042531 [Papaver californicum]
MSLTRGRSPGFFAIIIRLFILLTASAWKRNCIPGDIYIDSTGKAPLPSGTTCTYCTDWCDAQCSILRLPQVDYGCRREKNNDIKCRCCCGSSSPSPSSPPSLPLPPPAPQSESEFHGGYPHEYDICTTGQKYLVLNHNNGTECIHNPKCERGCKDIGLSMARKECVAGGYSFPPPAWYTWREQCCCETPPPPPPSSPPPSPLPPPPCTNPCCPIEDTMQVPGQKPCRYVLSPEPSTSETPHGDSGSLLFPAIHSE